MYICNDCDEIFSDDEVIYERVCWEDYYGVGSMFPDRHYGEVMTCPKCGSEGIEEYYEDDDEDDEE